MNNRTDLENNGEHPRNWKYSSPETPGLHCVVSPDNSPLTLTWVYRLNIPAGESHTLESGRMEMNGGIVSGAVKAVREEEIKQIRKLDSFYLPGNDIIELEATEDTVIYIGAAEYDGEGEFFFRSYEPNMPLGEVHQIHGEAPYEREVFMTLNQETPASRMINGFTWGTAGAWTSWPPHQHSADLEEVYFYFDLPAPHFALQLCSRVPGVIEAVHPVQSGDCVVIPEGYHPTVGCPGARSSYFWIMTAFGKKSRRYDLAKSDFGL